MIIVVYFLFVDTFIYIFFRMTTCAWKDLEITIVLLKFFMSAPEWTDTITQLGVLKCSKKLPVSVFRPPKLPVSVFRTPPNIVASFRIATFSF